MRILANTCSPGEVRRYGVRKLSLSPAARRARADQQGGGFDAILGADFSMRNTVSRSPRSMISNRSPIAPTKWGMSITASGSVQRTSSLSPGAKDFKALRVLSAGRGHFSPDRSNLMVVMARNVRIVRRQSIAPARLVAYVSQPGESCKLNLPWETAASDNRPLREEPLRNPRCAQKGDCDD